MRTRVFGSFLAFSGLVLFGILGFQLYERNALVTTPPSTVTPSSAPVRTAPPAAKAASSKPVTKPAQAVASSKSEKKPTGYCCIKKTKTCASMSDTECKAKKGTYAPNKNACDIVCKK